MATTKSTPAPKRSAPPAGPVRQHYELATTGKIKGMNGSAKPAPAKGGKR